MNQQETIIAEIKQLAPKVFESKYLLNPKGYINRTYRFLNDIKPGKVYNVSMDRIPRLFTLVISLYICEVKDNSISFLRDDLKQFRKNDKL